MNTKKNYYFKFQGTAWYVYAYYAQECPLLYQDYYDESSLTQRQRTGYSKWLALYPDQRWTYFVKYHNQFESWDTDKTTSINFNIEEQQMNSLADCLVAPVEMGQANVPMKKKKGNTMYFDADDCDCCTQAVKQAFSPEKRYLLSRVEDIANNQWEAARNTYYINIPDRPRTIKDLIERLTKGKFTYDKGRDENSEYYSLTDVLSWRAQPADEEGFKKAGEAISAAKTAANDAVVIGDIEAAGKAVHKFENMKF